MKVLLIDDNENILLVARLALERLGQMQVSVSHNGNEGLKKARTEQPDLILLDVMMPEMDGPTVFFQLQCDPATAAIPVVFLTAKVMPSEIARLKSLGARGVLTKPFDPLGFAQDVRFFMEEKHGHVRAIA